MFTDMEEALLQLSTASHFLPNFVESAKWVDPMRTIPFRYFGYGAALGEAIRGMSGLTEFREICYGTSGVFIMTHITLNSAQAITNNESFLKELLDTAAFDSLATVLIPMMISSRVRRYVRKFLQSRSSDLEGNENVIVWFPPVAAMTACVILARPVDYIVGTMLDAIISTIFRTTFKQPERASCNSPQVPKLPISPIVPIAPIAPIAPIPKPFTPKEAAKPEDQKANVSVIISGHPDCNFNVTINNQTEAEGKYVQSCVLKDVPRQQTARVKRGDGNEVTSLKSINRDCQTSGHDMHQQEPQFYVEKCKSTNARRQCEACPKKIAEEIELGAPVPVHAPIIFKNFNFLSSISPRRPIYKDPYEDEATGENTSRSRISSVIESAGFDCPPISSSVGQSVARKCWSYEGGNYHGGSGSEKSRHNSVAEYSDRRYD